MQSGGLILKATLNDLLRCFCRALDDILGLDSLQTPPHSKTTRLRTFTFSPVKAICHVYTAVHGNFILCTYGAARNSRSDSRRLKDLCLQIAVRRIMQRILKEQTGAWRASSSTLAANDSTVSPILALKSHRIDLIRVSAAYGSIVHHEMILYFLHFLYTVACFQ